LVATVMDPPVPTSEPKEPITVTPTETSHHRRFRLGACSEDHRRGVERSVWPRHDPPLAQSTERISARLAAHCGRHCDPRM